MDYIFGLIEKCINLIVNLFDKVGVERGILIIFLALFIIGIIWIFRKGINRFMETLNNTNKERKEMTDKYILGQKEMTEKYLDTVGNHLAHAEIFQKDTTNAINNTSIALKELTNDIQQGRERAIENHAKT